MRPAINWRALTLRPGSGSAKVVRSGWASRATRELADQLTRSLSGPLAEEVAELAGAWQQLAEDGAVEDVQLAQDALLVVPQLDAAVRTLREEAATAIELAEYLGALRADPDRALLGLQLLQRAATCRLREAEVREAILERARLLAERSRRRSVQELTRAVRELLQTELPDPAKLLVALPPDIS